MFVTSLPILKCSITAQMPDANLFLEFQPPTHSDFQISTTSLFSFPTVPLKLAFHNFHGLLLEVYTGLFQSSVRRQKKKSKSQFCVVSRAYFTTYFFYVLNCSLNLLAVLSSFQLHKRFLSDPGPNRNKLLLLRLDLCLSG